LGGVAGGLAPWRGCGLAGPLHRVLKGVQADAAAGVGGTGHREAVGIGGGQKKRN